MKSLIYDESGFVIGEVPGEQKDLKALVEKDRLEIESMESGNYHLNARKFSEVRPLFSSDYHRANLRYSDGAIVYSGLEHSARPKLPNFTQLPNLLTPEGRIVAGSTFGHQHIQKARGDRRKFQEIYEFFGYGAMLLRNEYATTLHVLKPGEKVLVGTGDNMAIINLQQKPLVTIDYANPRMNSARKDTERERGTLLFSLFGIDEQDRGRMEFRFNKNYLPLISGSLDPIIIPCVSLGEDLCSKIGDYAQEFEDSGINLVLGGNLSGAFKEAFSRPLSELAREQNKDLIECLEMS